MRIQNFKISKCPRKQDIWKGRLLFVLKIDFDDVFDYIAVQQVAAEVRTLFHLKLYHYHVQVCILNLNTYSEQ